MTDAKQARLSGLGRRARARLSSFWQRLRGSDLGPRGIALSVAVGLAIAFVPLYGIHSFLVVGICWLLRLDAPLAFASTMISNPLTLPFVLACELEVGGALVGYAPLNTAQLLAGEGWSQVALQLAVGASVLSVIASSVGACVVFGVMRHLGRTARACPSKATSVEG